MSRLRPTRTALAGLTLLAMLVLGTDGGAAADPARRSARRSQPVPIARTAPDRTATIPKPAAPAPPEPKDLGESIPTPYELPPAPRARMHACGQKWQVIKMSGRAGSDTWRDFATKCLTERDTASKSASH